MEQTPLDTIVERGSSWRGVAIKATKKYLDCEAIGFECPLLVPLMMGGEAQAQARSGIAERCGGIRS